jgi:SAM-dependent methyltransferase
MTSRADQTGDSEHSADLGNRAVYEDGGVVDAYAQSTEMTAGELAVFEPLAERLRSSVLLDIGVGAGRTTPYLTDRTLTYVGVDYSENLITAARRIHPDVDLRRCDARVMDEFDDSSFDVVNFSFNGIDYVGHQDRLRVLQEVRRVLVADGIWTFSSHNRDYVRRGLLPWEGRFKPGRVMLRKSAEAARWRANRRRLRRHQVETAEYALVNDEAHRYSLLTYYISPTQQTRQLENAGFCDVQVLDQWGTKVTGGSPQSMWLHYVCRRS